MSAISDRFKYAIANIVWRIRDAKLGALIKLSKFAPADPASPLAPLFNQIDASIEKMLNEDHAENVSDIVASIGWEYDDYFQQLAEDTIARAETIAMADDSFQLWLDGNFPELSPEARDIALQRYRTGTL